MPLNVDSYRHRAAADRTAALAYNAATTIGDILAEDTKEKHAP